MGNDFHTKPFDDGTLTKLLIFEEYIKEWLPVFLKKKKIIWKNINIFDFFAGPGLDKNGVKGSPLLILEYVSKFQKEIQSKGLNVNIYFNEFKTNKLNKLKNNIKQLDYDINSVSLNFSKNNFINAFKEFEKKLYSPHTANLILLDQSGIKHITESVFLKLTNLKQTDFIFFISSSFFNRFKDDSKFMNHLKIDKEDIKKERFYNIHQVIFNYYKKLLPTQSKYYLAPFSIKKGSHIYGLIFGTNHTLGMEKFLKVCWKLDGIRGTANFDIDSDNIDIYQPSFFEELNKPKKRIVFENTVRQKIISKQLLYDYDVYDFALQNGFLLKHSKEILILLIKENKINSDIALISSNLHKIKRTKL